MALRTLGGGIPQNTYRRRLAQGLVAGARGGSRLMLQPGAPMTLGGGIDYASRAGLGIEPIFDPLTAWRGIRGISTTTFNPEPNQFKPTMVPTIRGGMNASPGPSVATAFGAVGEAIKNTVYDAITSPTYAPAKSREEWASMSPAERQKARNEANNRRISDTADREYQNILSMYRAYTNGKGEEDFWRGAVMSPDGTINFNPTVNAFIAGSEAAANSLRALDFAGLGVGKGIGVLARFGAKGVSSIPRVAARGVRNVVEEGIPLPVPVGVGMPGIIRVGGRNSPVKLADKTTPTTQTRILTPEELNSARWGDPMGAPRGTGEARSEPRRGTPRFYRNQQGVGRAEFGPTQLGYTPETYADEFGMSVEDARREIQTLDSMANDVYQQNRGVGDAPIAGRVQRFVTLEDIKSVVKRSPRRYGNPSDEQLQAFVDIANQQFKDDPNLVWRLKDLEDNLLAMSDIHHGDTPFSIGGPGNPLDWRLLGSNRNRWLGARGK